MSASGGGDGSQPERLIARDSVNSAVNPDPLLAVLDPDVVLHADAAAVQASVARRAEGAPVLAPEVRGADAVAEIFKGRARAARLALIDDAAGLVLAVGGAPRVVFDFVIKGAKIAEIRLIADPDVIRRIDVQIENARARAVVGAAYASTPRCGLVARTRASSSRPSGRSWQVA